jgi:beta-glucosidase
MNMNIKKLLTQLTIEEKAALVSGTDFMYTNAIPRLGIPSLCMADGPSGLRKQIGSLDNGVSQSEPATAFPSAAAIASSWNRETARRMGAAIADECRYYGVHTLLGPGINLKRNPLCGRNFEYYSEDPVLSGAMGGAFVEGVQSRGVGSCVKHFALNNQENYRFMGESVCDRRALRELYLKPFETVVKKAKPAAMMCAYNKIEGEFCSENKTLLTDILRKEWRFDSVVMTDWGAVKDRVKGILAGLDLEMPGDTDYCRKQIIDAAHSGKLPMESLDQAAENVLSFVDRYTATAKSSVFDKNAHALLAADLAADCAVLMKNDGRILPLDKQNCLCVVGEMFVKMRYQGSGSSMINPTAVVSPKNAFDNRKIDYTYAKGYNVNTDISDESLLNQAVKAADGFDTVIIFAGLTDLAESEGCDRADMKLPANQLQLINALTQAGKRIVLVLFGGSPVELPFIDKVSAVLNMYLPGQSGGEAAARLLFGDENPSGKLAETWAISYDDLPYGGSYSKSEIELYTESIFVGYRYFLSTEKDVAFPFGFGLSYTAFDYSDLSVNCERDLITATCTVTNTGTAAGAEVVQCYVRNNPDSAVFKAKRELKGFAKVKLNPGESKQVAISFLKADLAYYNIREKRFVLENGSYEIEIGASSADIRLTQALNISDGENLPCPYSDEINKLFAEAKPVTAKQFERLLGRKLPVSPAPLPLTTESRLIYFKYTFVGRILYGAVTGVAKQQLKRAKKLPEGSERDNRIKGAVFLLRMFDSQSVRTMSMAAGKSLPYNVAEAFVLLANGHVLKGIRKIMSPYKVPALPKNERRKS